MTECVSKGPSRTQLEDWMLKECSGALHKDTLWGQNESLKPLRGRERNSHWHPGRGSPPQENSHQSCGLPEENDIK